MTDFTEDRFKGIGQVIRGQEREAWQKLADQLDWFDLGY